MRLYQKAWACAIFALSLGTPGGAWAQDGGIKLQLNRAETEGNDCRMTFVVDNGTGGDLSAAAYEVAVYATNGPVINLVVMDFGPLVAGRTRVVQFDVPDVDCSAIGQLSVNDPPVNCGVANGGAADACTRNRTQESLTDIAFQ